jgi:hypothetical protein
LDNTGCAMRRLLIGTALSLWIGVSGAPGRPVLAFAPQGLPPCAPADVVVQRFLDIEPTGSVYWGARVHVRAPGNCIWTVTTSGFVTIASGQTTYSTASQDVRLDIGPNPSSAPRFAAVTVQGHEVSVRQSGHPARGVAMDLNGDGRAELCSMSFVNTSAHPSFVIPGSDLYRWMCSALPEAFLILGVRTDKVVPADYNGDHMTDPAVFRPSTGEWIIYEGGHIRIVRWGLPGDIPVPADYDGDGADEVAVYRPSTMMWFIPGHPPFRIGSGKVGPMTLVPADYDGDGKADAAVYNPTTGTWTINDGHFGIQVVWGQAGDIPVPGDYNGDTRADIAVFRPSTGDWHVKDVMTVQWGAHGDIPLPLDVEGHGRVSPVVLRQTGPDDISGRFIVRRLDGTSRVFSGSFVPLMQRPAIVASVAGDVDNPGDRRADLTFFRPSEGVWYSRWSIYGYAGFHSSAWGLPSDQPLGADFTGDGHQDLAVFRSGTWFVRDSYFGGSGESFQWGTSGDIPLPGDYEGSGRAQLAVFRPSTGMWYIQGMAPFQWGQIGDVPVPADYDGDGRLDAAVWRPSDGMWSILCSSGRQILYQRWGKSGDTPIPADYDGDGRADFAVFRPSTSTWYVFMQFGYNYLHKVPGSSEYFTWSLPNTVTVQFGGSGDLPVPADYDGDGITDIATWTPATGLWRVRNGLSVPWGQPGDVPVVTINR